MNKRERNPELDVVWALLVVMTLLLAVMTACILRVGRQVYELKRAVAEAETVETAEIRTDKRTETAAEEVVLCSVEWPVSDPSSGPSDHLLPEEKAQMDGPSPAEIDYVLRVLTAEAGTDEVLCGCVAQALYNACERYDWAYSPAEMMVKYQYTDPASWVSAEAERAWDEVFCSGVVWDCVGKATVFYAPQYCESAYHESQRFVVEVNGVRFFEEVQG